MTRARVEVTITPNGKQPRSCDDRAVSRKLASRVRKINASRSPPGDNKNAALVDSILKAIATGAELPSRAKHFRGPDHEPVGPDVFAGITLDRRYCYDRLRRTPAGEKLYRALRSCSPTEDDLLHFEGHDGEMLREIVDGKRKSRIEPMRAVNPFNPVALLTPPSDHALCAVAAETILAGEPIAIYTGDVVAGDDPEVSTTNAYFYEFDMDDLKERGYKSSVPLGVDGSRRGSEARYINDKWGAGLPERVANCCMQLILDHKSGEPLVVVFAMKRIAKGREIILDYGPYYWDAATLLGEDA